MSVATDAQTLLSWSDLSQGISWGPNIPSTDIPEFQKAIFSSKMENLDGEKVIIAGYFLFLSGEQSVYLLSKNPMASCFFCGNGGPETIVGLKFAEKPSFMMDDLLSVEGTLRLNRDNPKQCYYRIEDATAISFK